jgi:hypothetical protein
MLVARTQLEETQLQFDEAQVLVRPLDAERL